jgi:hypothetical protein
MRKNRQDGVEPNWLHPLDGVGLLQDMVCAVAPGAIHDVAGFELLHLQPNLNHFAYFLISPTR